MASRLVAEMKAAASGIRSRVGGILQRAHPRVAWATGAVVLVAFVSVAAHHGEGRRFAELLRSAQPAWLGAAAALQTATYVCAAALAILWHRGELTGVLVAIGLAFLLLATGVPLALLGLRGRGRSLPRWLQRLPWANDVFEAITDAQPGAIFGGTLAPETVTLQLAIFALDAATLGIMLRAVATPADAAVVYASFVVASMVATLAWVPGGLGTFEAACVTMLHVHGVGIEAALAATLLTRGFTFWLPMAPGLAIARREMMHGATSTGPPAGADAR